MSRALVHVAFRPPAAATSPSRHTMYATTRRLTSVFPAPDSPLTSTATRGRRCSSDIAASATAYAWGSKVSAVVPTIRPRNSPIFFSPKSSAIRLHGLTEMSWPGPTHV